jgi:hypothetical protein
VAEFYTDATKRSLIANRHDGARGSPFSAYSYSPLLSPVVWVNQPKALVANKDRVFHYQYLFQQRTRRLLVQEGMLRKEAWDSVDNRQIIIIVIIILLLLLFLLPPRRYNSLRVLARSMINFHLFLLLACFFQWQVFITFQSFFTSSSHLISGLPVGLKTMAFHSVVFLFSWCSLFLKALSSDPSSSTLSRTSLDAVASIQLRNYKQRQDLIYQSGTGAVGARTWQDSVHLMVLKRCVKSI